MSSTTEVIRFLFITLFFSAVAGKMFPRSNYADFRKSLSAYGITSPYGTAVASALLTALEGAIVVLLAAGDTAAPRMGFLLAGSALSLFGALIIVVIRRGVTARCNCFGGNGRPFGRGHVARNAILAGLSLAAFHMASTVPAARPSASEFAASISTGVALGVSVVFSEKILASLNRVTR